jgi:hypothetical protein
MYVPPVSSASTPETLENENQIKMLEAKLNKIEQQLTDVNISDEDSQSKQQKIELLQAQMQQILMQIQKIKDEQTQKVELTKKENTSIDDAVKNIHSSNKFNALA